MTPFEWFVVVSLVVSVIVCGIGKAGADAAFDRVEKLENRDPTAPPDERDW